MVERKTKIVIITNNPLFFSAIQQELVSHEMELIYLQVIDGCISFLERVRPDVVIVNWINDPALEERYLELIQSRENKKEVLILIFPDPEDHYKQIQTSLRPNVIFYFSPISLHALIHNIHNDIRLLTGYLVTEKQKDFLQDILRIIYQIHTKNSIEEVLEVVLTNIPKLFSFDFYGIGLFNKNKKQLEIFKQFSPPVSREFLIVNNEFEKKIIEWSSFKSYRMFNRLEHVSEINFFNKLGWNVEQVFLFPLKKNFESIGFLLAGVKSGKVEVNENFIARLELIQRFLIQKLDSMLQVGKSNDYSLLFVQEILKSDYDEKNFFELLCSMINKIADTQATYFWQLKKGFHILFPKYYYGTIQSESHEQIVRNVIYLNREPEFLSILRRKNWQVYDYLYENYHSQESLNFLKKAGIHHMLAVPLVIDDVEVGVFTAFSHSRENIISPWNLNQINPLMEYAAKIYKTLDLVKEAGTKFKQLNKIFELGNELKLNLDTDKILNFILQAIRKTLGWNDIAILLYDETKQFLIPTKYVGFNKDIRSNISIDEPIDDVKMRLIFEESTRIGNSYFYREKSGQEENVGTDEEWKESDEVIIPIETSREVLGFMVVKDPISREKPGLDDIQPLEYFANQLAVAIDNATLYRALKSSEERYRSLADTMPLGLVTCNQQGQILYSNSKFQELTGIEFQALLNRNILECFAGENVGLFKKVVEHIHNPQEIVKLKEDLERGIELELTCANDQNESIPVSVQLSFLQSSGKERFFLVINDIREQKKLERMKENFNSMVVHDLRSPLNVIQGFLEMMLKKTAGPLTFQQEEFLNTAMDNVKKVLSLVDNFLIMSQINVGRFSINPQLGDINQLIRKISRQYEVAKKRKNIEFIMELNEDLPLILFDTLRIEQVLHNLLTNAFKYSPENSKIIIKSSLFKEMIDSKQQFFVQVSVQDFGIGIPENEIDKVFEIFEMAHTKTGFQKEGSGLGLAICKEIVEAHKGRIWVESVFKQGSTFFFTLPIPRNKTWFNS